MAQFSYINEINNVLTMDSDLTKGPMPRWQRKMEMTSSSQNASINTSRAKLSVSYNNSFSLAASFANNKTPRKTGSGGNGGKKTPSNKTPGGRKTPSPGRGAKTPSGGDRFIPNRGTSNFDLSHYLIRQEQQNNTSDGENEDTNNKISPSKADRQKAISEAMQIGDTKSQRILSYQNKAPAPPESHQNPLRVVYSVQTPISTKSGSRHIPSTSDRILDAPDILNDYYLNLMDWSADNIVTVALGNSVYLWNAASGNIEQLVEYEEGDHACSLSWIQEGQILAIGNNAGIVELWDCSKMKRLRVMDGHGGRVGALAWNSYIVTSGSRDAKIIHHDVRQRDHKVGILSGHTQEVCGLKWSTDNKYLASGGNDNLVNVWATSLGNVTTNIEPLHVLNQHQAAVRALAWCPWQPNVLATGGGTADRCIKFWNVNNGSLINSVDTKSQVCALLWSKTYKELISAHGYANNQLTIWKYPTMIKQAELTGHTMRVLQIAMSPDGSTVISASADETLRLWKCFAPDPNLAKKQKSSGVKAKPNFLHQSIR